MLLTRKRKPVLEAIEALGGLQAQSHQAPYVGLWSRIERFDPEVLSTAIAEKNAVRLATMRSTIHLHTSSDALAIRPLVQSVIERGLTGGYGKQLAGIDRRKLIRVARRLIDAEPMTLSQLEGLLAPEWPERDPHALGMAVRAWLPLVQVPPRGLWRRSGGAVHTSLTAWLGDREVPVMRVQDLIARYLAAFGPASVRDIQVWSGLTRLSEVTEHMKLRRFRAENGTELLDIPRRILPDPETPAPARYLPEYDNTLLSHADRTRVISDDHRARIFTQGAVLWDGFVIGSWRKLRNPSAIEVTHFERLTRPARTELEVEGRALSLFLNDEGDVRFVFAP